MTDTIIKIKNSSFCVEMKEGQIFELSKKLTKIVGAEFVKVAKKNAPELSPASSKHEKKVFDELSGVNCYCCAFFKLVPQILNKTGTCPQVKCDKTTFYLVKNIKPTEQQ